VNLGQSAHIVYIAVNYWLVQVSRAVELAQSIA